MSELIGGFPHTLDKETGAMRPVKKKGRAPLGTASLARGTVYTKVGAVFFKPSPRHPCFVVKADQTFTITPADALMVFLNHSNYKVMLVKRDAIIGI